MKKVLLGVVLMAVGLTVACQNTISSTTGGSSAAPAAPKVASGDAAATVGDLTISDGELTEKAKTRLQRVENDIYKIKMDVLNQMIDEKLIDDAAKKENLSKEEFIKKEVDSKITKPSEDEIKKFFEARKDQMGDKKFDDVKAQIEKLLEQNRRMGAQNAMMSKLRADAKIKINLEPPRVTVEVGDGPFIGPKDAKVTIVEFTDYQCPFCSRVRGTINELLTTYKDKIRYTLKDFPLSFHQFAKKAHEAALCAGDQDKYWDYNKFLWENQTALDIKDLKEYAKKAKLDTGKFDKCLDSGKHTADVEKNFNYGQSLGVTGTPSFFVNGIMMSGAKPLEEFKQIIDTELNR